jgi:TetR/AcrR family transcriptional repressor of lmrAB and yxaGH operons
VKDTRQRMLDAAVSALRRNGVAGMSFSEVLTDSGAARGAIYHHFPGGKTQLVAEAAALNGREVRSRFEQLTADDPRRFVEDFLAFVRPVVAESSTGSSCAVAAVAIGQGDPGNPGDQSFGEVSAAAFSSWVDALAEGLVAAGLAPDDAADLATTLITVLEGAHVLCRAAGSVEPFDRVAGTVRAMVESRYPAAPQPTDSS